MKNLFVPYHIAKLAKEKGFDEPCLAWYFDKEYLEYCEDGPENNNFKAVFEESKAANARELTEQYKDSISAPLYSQIVDWFREKHLIEVCASSYYYPIHYGIVSQIGYSHKSNTEHPEESYGDGLGKRQKLEKVIMYSERTFQSYYKALDKALEEAFKLIK